MENRFEVIVTDEKSHWTLENQEFAVAVVFIDYSVGEVRTKLYATKPPKKTITQWIKKMVKYSVDYEMMCCNQDGAEFEEE